MASVTLRMSDKRVALRNMIEAKFGPRYTQLIKRRRDLTMQVYEDTMGALADSLSTQFEGRPEDVWEWLDSRVDLALPGVPVPACVVVDPKNSRKSVEIFSGTKEPSHRAFDTEYYTQQMVRKVVWPDRRYHGRVDLKAASATTRKEAKKLSAEVVRFNEEVMDFYYEAESILFSLRSSKKVDAMFPELWKYLPTGLKERVKQAVVPLSQSDVDKLRKQLPA